MIPTPSQQAAIDNNDPEVLVLAGPGSGKTATLAARVHRLFNDGVSPNEIVAVTYTNAAARVLEKRIGTQLAHIGTLHSWMLKYLRQGPVTHNIIPLPEGADESMMTSFLKKHRCSASLSEAMRIKADGMAALKKRMRDSHGITAVEIVVSDYFMNLLQAGTPDFDMILEMGMDKVRVLPHTIKHLLVDEIQDAADTDVEIYRHFPARTKFYVGDSDQSIFGFRSAKPFDPISALRMRDIQIIALQENFRCPKSVCRIADVVIGKHASNRAFNKWNIPVEANGDGAVILRQFPDMAAAASGVVLEASALIQADPKASVAVLARTNWLAQKFTEGFRGLGVAIAETRMDNPKDWKLTTAILTAAANPENPILAIDYLKHKDHRDTGIWQLRTLAERDGRPLLKVADEAAYDSMKQPGFLSRMGREHDLSAASMERVDAIAEECGGDLANALLLLNQAHRPKKTDGVYVGTCHSAKGLEFDHVFIIGLNEGQFPPDSAKNDSPAMDEEARLMFVAVTRAHKSLVLVRWEQGNGQWHANKEFQPSRYWLSIEQEIKLQTLPI